MTWRVPSDQALDFRCWDDEFVVFDQRSGDTHLLGLLAGQILLQLQQAPADTAALTESLAPMWQAELAAELDLQITPLLDQLHTLALIEPVTL